MRIVLEIADAELRQIGSLFREGVGRQDGFRNADPLPDSLPLLLSVRRTAELLSISRSQCYELVGAGRIPSVRLGKSIRVPADELKRFVGSLEQFS